MTYGEIADLVGKSRSSIETSVARFNKKLQEELDGKLLGQLLTVAGSLGLGVNQVYNALVKKSLVPAREREIDGFDDLNKLI